MRKRLVTVAAVALAVALVAGAAFLVRQVFFGPTKISALFPTATSIYPSDEVRVAGVKVGTIDAIEPQGTQTKIVMSIDRGVSIPADAKAIVVAQNLISARYVQLTPSYRNKGPTMADGAVIPADRTAVPVEWDEVKTQLMRLATELGPKSDVSGTSVGRFIDSAANSLDGNGAKLRQTLAELSGVARILADGSGNLVDIIKNLATFVTALRDSNTQIVQFNNRLATLTSVVDDSRSSLDGALENLSVAVVDVQRFVSGTRAQTSEQVRSLASVTQNLVDNKMSLENLLHLAPNSIANTENIYNPTSGAVNGGFVLNNFANPVWFVCGMIGGIENTTAPETAKLCEQYLGPALRLLSVNNLLPFPVNAYLMPSADPEKIIYTDPKLAPGGAGAGDAPEPPPAVSAYTGLGDNVPPFGYGAPPLIAPGPNSPQREVAAVPLPPLFPRAPIPGQSLVDVNGMLLPDGVAPGPPAGPAPGAPVPPPPPPGNSLNGQPLLPAEAGETP